jgi:hypothetical protein
MEEKNLHKKWEDLKNEPEAGYADEAEEKTRGVLPHESGREK